jgi:hypothetical protein
VNVLVIVNTLPAEQVVGSVVPTLKEVAATCRFPLASTARGYDFPSGPSPYNAVEVFGENEEVPFIAVRIFIHCFPEA